MKHELDLNKELLHLADMCGMTMNEKRLSRLESKLALDAILCRFDTAAKLVKKVAKYVDELTDNMVVYQLRMTAKLSAAEDVAARAVGYAAELEQHITVTEEQLKIARENADRYYQNFQQAGKVIAHHDSEIRNRKETARVLGNALVITLTNSGVDVNALSEYVLDFMEASESGDDRKLVRNMDKMTNEIRRKMKCSPETAQELAHAYLCMIVDN